MLSILTFNETTRKGIVKNEKAIFKRLQSKSIKWNYVVYPVNKKKTSFFEEKATFSF